MGRRRQARGDGKTEDCPSAGGLRARSTNTNPRRGPLRGYALRQCRVAFRRPTDVRQDGAAAVGRRPAVWNTCLVFYQAVLLAGYLYAHLSLEVAGTAVAGGAALVVTVCAVDGLAHRRRTRLDSAAGRFPGHLAVVAALGFGWIAVSGRFGQRTMLQAWFSRTRAGPLTTLISYTRLATWEACWPCWAIRC